MDDKKYLEEGFNPKSLTVARLRGLLVEHEVPVPSNAKKAELVAAFIEHIAAIAPQLRQKYAADVAQPNGEGIVRATVKTPRKKSKRALLPEAASDDATSTKLPETHAAPDEASVPEATSPSIAPASPFSKDNIFQSPPGSSASILPSKRSKSPILPANDRLKLTKLSPRALTPRGKLFDNDDDDDDGERDDLFSSNMIVKTPIKIRKKETSKKSKDKTHRALQRLIKADAAKLESDASPEVVELRSKPTEGRERLASTEASVSTEERQSRAADDTQKHQSPSSPQVLNAPAEQPVSDAPAAPVVPVAPAAPVVPVAPAAPVVPVAPAAPVVPVASAAPGNVPAFGDFTSLAKELGVEIQAAPKLVTPIKSSTSQKLTPKSTSKRKKTPGNKKRSDDTQSPQVTPKAKADDFPKVASSGSKKKVSTLSKKISYSEKLAAQKHVPDNVNAINLLEHNIKDAFSDGKEYVTSRRAKPLAIALFGILWLVLLSAGLFGWWYREQTFLVGYCGQEIHQDTIPYSAASPSPTWLVKFGQYLDSYKPECVPCPPHGRCFPLLELSCYNDFVDDQPWWFNFVPYPVELKQCIPDTKKAEKLEIMIDVAMDLLRARNANTNCGRNAPDDLSSGLSVQELHDMLLQMKAPYITMAEFNDLWQRSLVEMEKEFEIIVRHVGQNNLAGSMGLQGTPHPDPLVNTLPDFHTNTQTGYAHDNVSSAVDIDNEAEAQTTNKIFRSTSLSHISLKCQIQNTVIGSLNNLKFELFAALAAVVAVQFLKYKWRQYNRYQRKVSTIYTEVLSKLRKQRKLAARGDVPRYIGSTQLRDLILTNELNLNNKRKLWQRVSRKVENNLNIRFLLQEIHGEVMRVWEWITDIE